MDTPVVGRFAPSPSGRMHLGNLFSALLAWLSARSAGGRMLLRIEDLDPDRCRREFALQLMDDLRWLGLDWDGTPVWQSERTALYADAFSRLEGRGLLYPCFCTRAQRLAASAPPPGQRRAGLRRAVQPPLPGGAGGPVRPPPPRLAPPRARQGDCLYRSLPRPISGKPPPGLRGTSSSAGPTGGVRLPAGGGGG